MYNVKVYRSYDDYIQRYGSCSLITSVDRYDMSKIDGGGFLIVGGDGKRHYLPEGLYIIAEPLKTEEEE